MPKQLFLALVYFLHVGLCLAAPPPPKKPAPPVPPAISRDAVLVIAAVGTGPASLHPYLEAGSADRYAQGFAIRPLMAVNAQWELVCLLCTTIPSLEAGSIRIEQVPGATTPGVAVDITLKDNLRWGDSSALTSADFAFATLQRSFLPALLQDLREVTVKSPKEFTLHFSSRSVNLEVLTSFYPLPKHIEARTQNSSRSAYRRTPNDPGLYNGPYRLLGRGMNMILFERNPSFAGKEGQFSQIIVRYYPTAKEALAAFASGRADFLASDLLASSDDFGIFLNRRSADDDNQVIVRPSMFFEHVLFNIENPLLTDKRVRLALSLALDRRAMNVATFESQAIPANSFISPLDPNLNPALTVPLQDIQTAKKLLNEAGFTHGADGILVSKSGQPFRLTLLTTEASPSRATLQQMIRNAWNTIGITVEPRLVSPAILFGHILPKRQFDGAILFAIASAPGAQPGSLWHSSQIPTQDNAFTGQNYSGYRSKNMDTLLDSLNGTQSPGYRQQLRRNIQQLYADDLPTIPLFFRPARYLLPDTSLGIPTTGHQFPSSLWAEEWYIPAWGAYQP
ncbi:MAG: peptide ABC transporter substrate-binding protein [Holosporales bacterium]|jgi:peptide/nickel transport system substrate-binding protein